MVGSAGVMSRCVDSLGRVFEVRAGWGSKLRASARSPTSDGVRMSAARSLTSHCYWHRRSLVKRYALVGRLAVQQNAETLGIEGNVSMRLQSSYPASLAKRRSPQRAEARDATQFAMHGETSGRSQGGIPAPRSRRARAHPRTTSSPEVNFVLRPSF